MKAEPIRNLLLKTQVDRNELTGQEDPVVQLVDFGFGCQVHSSGEKNENEMKSEGAERREVNV